MLAVTAQAQINYAKIEILTEKYTPNLYMLAGAPGDADLNHPDGAGGRIGILTGPDGIFMVDSQYTQVTDKVLAAIRKISTQPIRFLTNTHLHVDHSGGNAKMFDSGAEIISTANSRKNILEKKQTNAPPNVLPARALSRWPSIARSNPSRSTDAPRVAAVSSMKS